MSSVIDTQICEAVQPFPIPEIPTKDRLKPLAGLRRRLARERRRRKVGRAYDMALEIARLVPDAANVLDVGCGNGYIAHHLGALLHADVLGIDVTNATEAPINYHQYDGMNFPLRENSVDAVLLCYVLHHTADALRLLNEVKRVLRRGGTVIIYEDIPEAFWDKMICWIHNRQWKDRTGPCTFRTETEWAVLFASLDFDLRFRRRLSRWRNFTHSVRRSLFVVEPEPREAVATDRLRTRRRSIAGVHELRRWNCRNLQDTPSSEVESGAAVARFAGPPAP